MLDPTQATLCSSLVKKAIVAFILLLGLNGCNPFAPGLDDAVTDPNLLLGDRRKIDGFFDYFKNTYELRDSTLYGRLLANDFIFSYTDFDQNNQVYWGRDQEMQLTHAMFRSVKQVNLTWNSFTAVDTATSDTIASVERFFNLNIIQNDQTILRSTGRARLTLYRKFKGAEWRIKYWTDDSGF
ncbi:MAG: hypothetical protein ACOVMN_10725 [Flexibacteraceae bacterium]